MLSHAIAQVARMRRSALMLMGILAALALQPSAFAQEAGGGEANLVLPNLHSVPFFGTDGHNLLLVGLFISLLGMVFGMGMYMNLKNLPVHRSMLEISELIYETCKTYLTT
ncbi:MAG: Inorganic diphosphatase, partial [Acidobacteriaceae bacterium]|nr:Inorganic diphosphatase [Acidobacteriaceae bacterium]